MSNFSSYSPKAVSLKKLRKLVEEAVENGDITTPQDVDQHVRYWVADVYRTRAKYDSMTRLWTVEFTTRDDEMG